MFLRMSNTEKTDVATVDGSDVESRIAFADKAEKLLRAILVALGYENAGALRGADLIAGITAWVTLLITMKREPGGSYASFWARAFLDVCKDLPVDDAAECADNMTNQFARRYPPMLDDVAIDDDSRDTQSDLQSAMAELDKQTQLVWQLESERNALLRANEHHASELATCRIQLEERTAQRDQFMRAMDKMDGTLVQVAKPERVEPGQRWAMVCEVAAYQPNELSVTMTNQEWFGTAAIRGDSNWHYLGTDKV